MDADRVFIRRYEQVVALSKSRDELDLVDLSLALYQLLADATPLMNLVNQERRQVLFKVLHYEPSQPGATVLHAALALDPTHTWGQAIVYLKRDAFLKAPVLISMNEEVTVLTLISFTRNALGGGHYNPLTNDQKYDLIKSLRQSSSMNGLPGGIFQLTQIGLVTAAALQELYNDAVARVK